MLLAVQRQEQPAPGGVLSEQQAQTLAALQAAGGKHLHRDSFGRFAADSKTGDNTSLGWNDFMTMASFTDPEQVCDCGQSAS